MNKSFESISLGQLNTVAFEVLKFIGDRKKIFLVGGMGAGKTTFTKAIVSALGSVDGTSSPTFSIVNEYHMEKGLIHHIDLYRLNSLQEVLETGIGEYLEDDDYCIIEWPNLVKSLQPTDLVSIEITLNEDDTRNIYVSYKES